LSFSVTPKKMESIASKPQGKRGKKEPGVGQRDVSARISVGKGETGQAE